MSLNRITIHIVALSCLILNHQVKYRYQSVKTGVLMFKKSGYLALDADGEQAEWADDVGMAHPEFVYGITRAGQVVLEPAIPYRAVSAK
jgi:hypothetical protein